MVRTGACALALAAAAFGLGACGDEPPAVAAAERREIGELELSIPLDVDGLDVEEEDITETLQDGRRPYLDAAGLYSFREDDLLQATLQVGRFAPNVDADDEDFINGIITSIGPGAREVRMGEQQLYLTGADRQTLAVWFRNRHMFILSTRDGFEGGRALLREAVELQP